MKNEISSSKSQKTRVSSAEILLTLPNENGIEEEFILLNSPVLSPKLQKIESNQNQQWKKKK